MTASLPFGAAVVRSIAVAAAVLICSDLPASAASSTSAAPRPAVPKAPDATAQRSGEPDPAARNVVARTRMLECGHQWNSQKKNGTASGTWKDFSRGCLAQR